MSTRRRALHAALKLMRILTSHQGSEYRTGLGTGFLTDTVHTGSEQLSDTVSDLALAALLSFV